MSRSLRRLLNLRRRLEDVARLELQVSQAALRDTETALAKRFGPEHASVQSASDLQFEEMLREQGYKRREQQAIEVVERHQGLRRAKQEHRQIEVLVQRRDAEVQAKAVKTETAMLDDWYRANQWEDET